MKNTGNGSYKLVIQACIYKNFVIKNTNAMKPWFPENTSKTLEFTGPVNWNPVKQ